VSFEAQAKQNHSPVLRLCRFPSGKPLAFRQSQQFLAAPPPEAEPLLSKVANGKPAAFRTGGGKAAYQTQSFTNDRLLPISCSDILAKSVLEFYSAREGGPMSFNKITMVGNVGREPELRRLSDGATVCNFNLAVDETSRDKKGAVTSSPTWFRVTVWGERAVICARSLKKGSAVYVAGRLKPKQWEDKTGERRFSLEVKASDVRFFGLANSRSVRVA